VVVFHDLLCYKYRFASSFYNIRLCLKLLNLSSFISGSAVLATDVFFLERYSAMIMWKTQSPWPSLRGFLYDAYLEPTG
jgi:hypothetical protein